VSIGLDASFRTLGLPLNASADEVRSAYRRLVRLHHPDANPTAQPGALSDVVRAYRALERARAAEGDPVFRPGDGGFAAVASSPRLAQNDQQRPRIDVYA